MKYILVIAGSDSCGGAGIQADIRTITSLGAHASTAVTVLTAQNSLGITAIHKVSGRFIWKQLETIVDDLIPDAVKIGMLYSKEAVKEVARFVKKHCLQNVVLDPVLSASTGKKLLESGALSILKKDLIPVASIVTPNLFEAEILAHKKIEDQSEMPGVAKVIKQMGPDVVITGGHLQGECVDVLYNGSDLYEFCSSRIDTDHTHGSGCVFSSALATFLAQKKDVVKATKLAHDFVRCAILKGYPCGRGSGPVRPESGNKQC
jgi:hydroxymethylpyrimidine/phosphomethylpyrimidine kinase